MGEINVKVGGARKIVRPGDAYFRRGDILLPIVGVFIKRGTKLETIWDYTPPAPKNLDALTQDYVSVSLQWGASPGADKYELLRRNVDANGDARPSDPAEKRATIAPNDGTFWTNRTWKDTGLKANTTYIYTVRAVNNQLKVDVQSPESNAVKVYTGVTEQREHGSSRHQVQADKDKPLEWQLYNEFQPTKVDTYSKAKEWGTRAGRAGQGTYDESNNENRNQFGCVDYSGIYNRMVSLHGQANVNGVTKNIADYINVTEAVIQKIGRPLKEGVTTPTLRLHCGNFSIGTPIRPSMMAGDEGMKEVVGPKFDQSVGPFTIRNLWANHWSRPPSSRIYQGIVVFRADMNHNCVLAGVNEKGFENSWDLFLTYEWDFVTRTAKAPKTTDYTWPA